MNGRLHLGHAFTLLKVDAQIKYKQLQGTNVLFPFAFHCSGVPIKAAADTLKEEIEQGVNETTDRRTSPQPPYQYHIMMDMDIPPNEIPSFVNYTKWFEYFPTKAQEDLKQLGISVDWRRSFITTHVNPYYDKFVQWYFKKLMKKGYIKHGNQYTVWSLKEQQPVSDHGRREGEGVKPTRYTMIKTPIESSKYCSFGSDTYLIAMTSQPDNIQHQTEFHVHPTYKYGMYELNNGDYVVCNESAAVSLAYQGHTHKFGKPKSVNNFVVTGDILSNCKAQNVATGEWIPIVCDHTVVTSKGSGIVCFAAKDAGNTLSNANKNCGVVSKTNVVTTDVVPSDRKFDYYQLDQPVITRSGSNCVVAYTPQWYIDYSNKDWCNAVKDHIINKMVSPEITKTQLLESIDWLHEKSFGRDATQNIGTKLPWDSSQTIDSLSDSTVYMMYYTVSHYLHKDINGSAPANVKLEEWTDRTMDYIFGDDTMDRPSPVYYDANRELRVSENIDIFEKMRDEFRYWYPLNLRVSGKDLLKNHLPFCLFHHVALLGSKLTPLDFRVNGYIQINNQKMSKSQGNFITIAEAIQKFGVDATRFTLADAGDDPTSDANFNTSTAISIKGKLERKLERTKKYIELCNNDRLNNDNNDLTTDRFSDFFKNRCGMCIEKTKEAYEQMRLKDVCYWAYFELEKYKKQYEMFAGENTDRNLMLRYTKDQALLLYPIIPHFAKTIINLIDKQVPSSNAGGVDTLCYEFPKWTYQQSVVDTADFYNRIWNSINVALKDTRKDGQTTGKSVRNIKIVCAKNFPEWTYLIRDILLQSNLEDNPKNVMKNVAMVVNKQQIDKKDKKIVMTSVKKAVQNKDMSEFSTETKPDIVDIHAIMDIMSRRLDIPIVVQIVDRDSKIVPDKPKIEINIS